MTSAVLIALVLGFLVCVFADAYSEGDAFFVLGTLCAVAYAACAFWVGAP